MDNLLAVKIYKTILEDMARTQARKGGRVRLEDRLLMIERDRHIEILHRKGYANKDIAFIFNLHPSQITRSLKK